MKLSFTETGKSVGGTGIAEEEQEFNFGHAEFNISVEYINGCRVGSWILY
jgi:hypothetical protein